jgi:hypothetical protein
MDIGPQAEYFQLLHLAEAAAQSVDDFDFHDDEAQSVGEMESRIREQRTCNLALIHFVRDHLAGIETFLTLPTPVAEEVHERAMKTTRIVET